MKKIVTTWLCAAFISTFSYAQFEFGTHTSAPNFEKVLQGDNLALIYDSFFAFNDTGQIVGSDYFSCQVQGSAIIALDSSTTWVNACVSDIIFTNLTQYDKEMNLNQTVPLYGDIYNPSKGSGLSGNRIVLSEETYLQANNMDGTFIWAVTNSGEITDLHTTHGDTILAVSPGGLTLYSQGGGQSS